jgi:hypothetical protein
MVLLISMMLENARFLACPNTDISAVHRYTLGEKTFISLWIDDD